MMPQERQPTRQQSVLQIGAACVVLGSVLIMLFRTTHGDLPADQGAVATLSYVAAHPIYPLFHLGDSLGFLLFAGGLVALSDSLSQPVAWAIGRVGMASVLVGTAVHVVDFSIDGFGLPLLAQDWAVASPAQRQSLELGAQMVLAVIGGPSVIALIFVWGATLVLYGLAVQQEGYSRWLGWAGVIVGAALGVLGILFYLRPNSFPGGAAHRAGAGAAGPDWHWLGVLPMVRFHSTLSLSTTTRKP